MNVTRSLRGLIALLAGCIFGLHGAEAFTDNFDSYPTGTTIIGQGGWMGWDNNSAYNATLTSGGLSAPNRVFVTGSSDIVKPASAQASVRLLNSVRAKVFVPSTSVGDTYFILLNRYAHAGPYSWSVQLRMNAAQALIQENRAGAGPSLPLVTDQWKEIRCEIDTGNNVVSVYYDGQHLVTQPWKIPGDPNAQDLLAAVDLYSDNPNSVAYYDDLRVDPGGPTLIFGHFHTRLGSATLDVVSQPDGLKLLVDNLLHPGDGAKVEFEDETDGMDLDWDPVPDGDLPAGAQLELEAMGFLEGSPTLFSVGKVLIRKAAMKELEYVNSYTGESFTIEAYFENHRVGISPAGPGGRVADVAGWPRWVTFRNESVSLALHHRSIFVENEGKPHDIGDVWLGLGSRETDGDGAQAVQLPNGTVVLANLIRIVPNNAGAKPKPKKKETKHVYGGWNQRKSWPIRVARRDFGVIIGTTDNVTALKKKKDPPPSNAMKCCIGKHIALSTLESRFTSGPGEGFHFDLEQPVEPVDPQARMTVETFGVHNGVHQRVKRETLQRNGSQWDISCDFSDIGSSSVRVVGMYLGASVVDVVMPNGFVASSTWLAISNGIWNKCWTRHRTVSIAGTPYDIDEFYLLPGDGSTLDNIDEVVFHLEDMELNILDVHSHEYGLVQVHLDLEGCGDPTGLPFTVILRNPVTREVYHTEQIVLDGSGNAEFRVPDFRPLGPDPEVLVQAPVKWLAKLAPANGTHFDNRRIDLLLMTGDIDSDNEITIGDYALLSSAFGTFPGMPGYDPNADLDCDDEITIGDYALLSQNFGLTGDD